MSDFNGLLANAKTKLQEKTQVRAFSTGSIARALLETYIDTATSINNSLNIKMVDSLLSYSSGTSLDELGRLVGVARVGSSYALGPVQINIDPLSGKSLADLKAIIASKVGEIPDDIVIPKGLEITNTSGAVVYNTINDVTLSDDPVYVDALSSNYGVNGNVASGVLTKLRITSEPLIYIADYLIVSNPAPIDSGSDTQNDDNYRYAIANAYSNAARANYASIRLAALSVPGVADVVRIPYLYGIGTSGLFVISESPIVSQGVINAVQVAVDNVKADSQAIIVSAPTYVAFKMNVVLQFTPATAAGEKDQIVTGVTKNVINYVNNLLLGEEIVLNELRQVIQQTSENIYDHQITKLGVGDYNLSTGLVDYFNTTIEANQQIDNDSKFVTNEKLVTVCYE